MSNPADPLLIPVTNQTAQICPPLGQGTSVLILNTDSQANLYIGRSDGMTASNALTLPPGASSIEDASKAILGFTDATNPPIYAQIGPGTSQYNLGPGQVLNDISIAALATAIATSLIGTPFSLLGSPVLLYDIGPSGPTISGQWGATVYGTLGQGFPAAFTAFETTTNRSITSFKIYNLSYNMTLTQINNNAFIQEIQALATQTIPQKVRACLCFNDIPFTPTPAQLATFAATLANFATALSATVAPLIVPYQEVQDPKLGISASQYTGMMAAIYSTVQAAFPGSLVYDSYGNGGLTAWQNYDPFPNVDIYALDLYAYGYYLGNDPAAFIAIAHTRNKPWALFEIGASVGNQAPPSIANTQAYIVYVTSLVTLDLDAGKPVDSVMWYYQPQKNTNNDPTPFVTQIQALADALTSGSIAPTTIGPGATLVLPPLAPSKVAGYASAMGISYDIRVNLIAGASSTIPFLKFRFTWYDDDDPNAKPIDTEQWVFPMGVSTSSGTQIWGKGPQRGAYLKISAINADTKTCTIQCQINSTSRTVNRDDIRWDCAGSVNVPGFTLAPDGGAYANQVSGVVARSCPATGSVSYLCSLYAGRAYVRFGTAASTAVISVSMTIQPTSVFNGAQLLDQLLSGTGASGPGDYDNYVTLPRAPCIVTFSNSDAVAHNVFATIVAEETG